MVIYTQTHGRGLSEITAWPTAAYIQSNMLPLNQTACPSDAVDPVRPLIFFPHRVPAALTKASLRNGVTTTSVCYKIQ